jgi:DNA-binding protein Fis
MNEQAFLQTIYKKALDLNINPLLLLSGIEGLYSFRDVTMNAMNYELLDSLILTIFAVRVGDQFHTIAEENLLSTSDTVRQSAKKELTEMTRETIASSDNKYLQSFAKMLDGKTAIRNYHIKALEVAALEIKKLQLTYASHSIGSIMLGVCKEHLQDELNLGALFNA